jgi:3-carboxy-cis,cis-muconate cycloisomerase
MTAPGFPVATTVLDSILFRDAFGTPRARAIFSDHALISRYAEVEIALARAEARCGVIPAEAAAEIAARTNVDAFDFELLRKETDIVGYPILPVVHQMAKQCGEAGRYVHWGATTQDIMDTAVVLQVRDALTLIDEDLDELRRILRDLAQRYRDTPMPGRTHLQQALPITFGYKLAVWVAEADRHLERLSQFGPRVFRGQLAGAVGTLASIGEQGLELQALFCEELGLAVPEIAWHTARDGVAETVCAYALVGGTLAKIANEVIDLQRTEVGEVEEPFHRGKVGSSTMPHKWNPSACEHVVALGRLLHAQVVPALQNLVSAHERDKRTGVTEQAVLPEASCLLAGMLRATRGILAGLHVYPERMRENLGLLGGLLASEAVMLALARHIGRQRAHEVVYELCMDAVEDRMPLRGLLLEDPRVNPYLGETDLDTLLEPARHTGLAARFVDRVTPP